MVKEEPEKKSGEQRGSPLFWQNPISYILYLWYSPILWKVSLLKARPWGGHGRLGPLDMPVGGCGKQVATNKPAAGMQHHVSCLQGYKNTLQYDDLWQMPVALRTDSTYPSFGKLWKQEVETVEQSGPQVSSGALSLQGLYATERQKALCQGFDKLLSKLGCF